jgi:NAD(P)-dependent dehydrogenase (short-subunit alcohol dehydrogenase family)
LFEFALAGPAADAVHAPQGNVARKGGTDMAGQLDGKVALVTGAASGIGQACAERLAREGAAVVVADVQDAQGEAVVQRILKAGGRGEYVHLDVTDEDSWTRAFAGLRARHGRLDVLVNNAGIALGRPTAEMSLADFRRQMAVNVDGVFLGCKHAIPMMREQGGGSIINMSSTAGLRGSANMAGYSASKGAVRLFTKAVANEHAHDQIRVNSVHPGIIETPIWATVNPPSAQLRADKMPDLEAMSARIVPMGIKGVPEDIAAGVAWLASDESRYVTGAELVIDGGMSGR